MGLSIRLARRRSLSTLARQLPTTFRTFPVVMFHDGYYENDMQHLGSINVMTRYEPGFDRLARAVVSQIPKRIYGTKQEVSFHEVVPQNEVLTNKILASLPALEFKRLLPFFEPVALSSGEDLNRRNESDDFVYF